MSLLLKNKDFELTLNTAGEQYQGCRFDWNGAVVQVSYKGLNLLSKETDEKKFNPALNGQGLYGEFGIKNCIGYDDCQEGGWFPKIGTGWLKKDSKPYFFANSYERESINFSYEQKSDKIIFSCDSGVRNGYGYKYDKTVTLLEDGFMIEYRLENIGEKNLKTTEYVHNFINPGDEKIDSHISVSLPWDFNVSKLVENVRTQGLLNIGANTIKVLHEPKSDFFLGGIWQAREYPSAVENLKGKWELCDTKHKIMIREKDSFTPCNCDIWGYALNISPEMFIMINAEPGQIVNWNRKYIINDIS